MLIRLAGHFLNNSMHIDKLICIKGLPDDWIFKTRSDGQKELNPPFAADNPQNIPSHIRHLCTQVDVVKYFPPIEKGKDGITDKMTILGVKLDFMTEAGRNMWTRIQRYMEDCMPRHAKIPDPVLVAKDQRSPFETFKTTKRITGGVEMEPSDVPVVDLDLEKNIPNEPISPPVVFNRPSPPIAVASPPSLPAVALFKCAECEFTHVKKQGVSMHRIKRHSKAKVGT